MSQWFLINKFKNKQEQYKHVKVVQLNIDANKFSSTQNMKMKNNGEFALEKPRHCVLDMNYYDRVDVVDVKTLSQDIKRLLREMNTKMNQDKFNRIVRSINLISMQCENLTQKLSIYEERLKYLEDKSSHICNENKQMIQKIINIQQLLNNLNNDSMNCEQCQENKTEKVDKGGKEDAENRKYEVTEQSEVCDLQKDVKLKMIFWQIKEKFRTTYNNKLSQEKKLLLKKADSISN